MSLYFDNGNFHQIRFCLYLRWGICFVTCIYQRADQPSENSNKFHSPYMRMWVFHTKGFVFQVYRSLFIALPIELIVLTTVLHQLKQRKH